MSSKSSFAGAIVLVVVFAMSSSAEAQLLRSRSSQCTCQPPVVRYCPTPQYSYAQPTARAYSQPTARTYVQPTVFPQNPIVQSTNLTPAMTPTFGTPVYSQPTISAQPNVVSTPMIAYPTVVESVPSPITTPTNLVPYTEPTIATPTLAAGNESGEIVVLESASDIPVQVGEGTLVPTAAQEPVTTTEESAVPTPVSTGDAKIIDPQPTPPAAETNPQSILKGN